MYANCYKLCQVMGAVDLNTCSLISCVSNTPWELRPISKEHDMYMLRGLVRYTDITSYWKGTGWGFQIRWMFLLSSGIPFSAFWLGSLNYNHEWLSPFTNVISWSHNSYACTCFRVSSIFWKIDILTGNPNQYLSSAPMSLVEIHRPGKRYCQPGTLRCYWRKRW